MSTSLLRDVVHTSVCETLYKQLVTRSARYYYFLGKTLPWSNEAAPDQPIDNNNYNNNVRNTFVTLKDIAPSDVSFVIPRVDWLSGTVYDQYDDQYSTSVVGINLISGGTGYLSAPRVFVGTDESLLWVAATSYNKGVLVRHGNNCYVTTTAGISSAAPTHTTGTVRSGTLSLLYVCAVNTGVGARAVATVSGGKVTSIELTNQGYGYVSAPLVVITHSEGVGAAASSQVAVTKSGAHSLHLSNCYAMNSNLMVYKCLDNNRGAPSTSEPIGISSNPVRTADGYLWKFMYMIPVALRNKYLTEDYMPVITGLSSRFYSAGSIRTINVDNMGSDYSYARLTVVGDGFLAANPMYATGYTIDNAGSGYTAPTVTFSSPVPNASAWVSGMSVLAGQYIKHADNVYRADVSGDLGTVGPTHTSDAVKNGTVVLQYVGTTMTANVNITDGTITSLTLLGNVKTVDLIASGSGYNHTPAVTINGDGSGATAVAIVYKGSVVGINVTNSGAGYSTNPSVTIGSVWTSAGTVLTGDQISYNNILYTVKVGGTLGATAPVHITGDADNGDCTLTAVGNPASAISDIKYGAGYSALPSATILDADGVNGAITVTGEKSEAVLYGLVENGQLVGAHIADGGVAYTRAEINVFGDGDGALLSTKFTPGSTDNIQSDTESLVVDGGIYNMPVTSGGYGYTNANVTVVGDGDGAAATATIVGGRVTKININGYGSGYRNATVIITGDGEGAKARAIISPFGGHGKDPIYELFTKHLMLYCNISNEKNKGFTIDNNYRQIGIISTPRVYGAPNLLNKAVASACWTITSPSKLTTIAIDDVVYDDIGKQYQVVAVADNDMLVIPVGKHTPELSTAIYGNNTSFTISSVSAPDVDKYSGEVLFIDNAPPFTPAFDQIVTMRTTLQF